MNPKSKLIFLALAAVFLFPDFGFDSHACSIFAIRTDRGAVYGQNLDWYEHFPGVVLVNVRGVEKTILPWKGSWPAPSNYPDVSWVSRYGSVTFTCYGRDFIDGGMNEAGLVVDEASLASVYPPDDGRPGVSCAQWMQYQLDNYATVAEVIEHLGDLRPDGEGWHYLIADATGDCAAIEYLDGTPTVIRGDELEWPALTNTTYAQALTHITIDTAFGGDIDIAAGTDSYARFVRLAALMRDRDLEEQNPVEYAFHMLSEVSGDETLRSVVYDARTRRVHWKTQSNTTERWLDLAALDLSNKVGTRFVDVEFAEGGDTSVALATFTLKHNRELVNAVRDSGERSEKTMQKLKERGLTYDEALALIARHPFRAE
jgi:choloylglycine hydrolase